MFVPPGDIIKEFLSLLYFCFLQLLYLVSILKLRILIEIEAWKEFYRRHIIDIPRIKL